MTSRPYREYAPQIQEEPTIIRPSQERGKRKLSFRDTVSTIKVPSAAEEEDDGRKKSSEESSEADEADNEDGTAQVPRATTESNLYHYCVHLIAYLMCAAIMICTFVVGYILTRLLRVSLGNSPSLEDLYFIMSEITKALRFTKNVQILSRTQREFYEKNGYLVIPRLVPQNILDKCNARFDEIISGKVPCGGMIVMRDVVDKKSVNKIQDINYDDVFREYIEYKELVDIVEAFTGPNILAVHSMLIAKPPDVGSKSTRHPPHQDLYYFPFRPADLVVGVWTAIEPCDHENGCLFVSPGSHELGQLFPHDYPEGLLNKFYHGIQNLPETVKWIELEMQPGDTVFFHPLLIHGSGVNVSNRSRRAISCHYAAAECNYIDVRNTVQHRIEKEVTEVARKRLNMDVKYTDIWRFKSSLVRGIRSSL